MAAKHLPDMQRKKPDVDIISDILKLSMEAYPDSTFVHSLNHQYIERGGLSKKQLEGLYQKALKVKTMPVGKLATLEAVILKKPTRYKSELPANTPLYEKDEQTGAMIQAILAKYPEHKRVLFFQSKFENNQVMLPAEIAELQRFAKMLK